LCDALGVQKIDCQGAAVTVVRNIKRILNALMILALGLSASGCTVITVAGGVVGTGVAVASTAVDVGVAVGSTAVGATTSVVKAVIPGD
jgi:hypothetical protein